MNKKTGNEITGPGDPQRLQWEMSLGEFLEAAVRRNPAKVFVEIAGWQLTYGEFWRRVRQTAGLFQGLGIGPGDRVCLFLPNCPEFLYCWFGLSLLGAISVPINTAYKRDEMAYLLNHSGARGLVTHPELLPVATAAAALSPELAVQLLVSSQPPVAPPWQDFTAALEAAGELATPPQVSPHDISMLVYTSGTTGHPKGVQVTHLMYVSAGQGFAHWTQATEDDRFFTCLPYFHANAQYYSTMGTLAAGATLIVADRFSASHFWEQVRQAGATVVNFIGMMLPVLSKQPESPLDREHRVRLFYGSPAFAPDFLGAFQDRFGIEIIVGFGMTETCYGVIERLGEPRRANSSGLPRLHPDARFINQVRVADEAGRHLPAGTVGEIIIKNPALLPGYWRDEEQTRLALRDGWLHTGDLAWLDEDGYLYFVDRKKDVIRRRGENISSQEVEEVIKRHPTVLDCAVIAVPSELGEDEVKAYLTPRLGAAIDPAEIVRWCAEQLAYFKVPRYLEVREEMPRTPSLRVRKDVLRQERADLTQGCFDREQTDLKLR